MSAVPIVRAKSDWPIWVQVIVSSGVALMWMTVITWIVSLFTKGRKDTPGQSQVDSPSAQQQHANSTEGDVIQTGDKSPITTGDSSPITYVTAVESSEPIAPVLDGEIRGPNVFVRIHNSDSHPHQFRVVFHGVSGMVGKPRVRDLWLPWNCGDFQLVGPNQTVIVQVAQAAGETKGVGRVIRFIHDKERQFDGRLSEYVAPGGQLDLDLELQSDAVLEPQSRRTWTLNIDDSGTPVSFTPQ